MFASRLAEDAVLIVRQQDDVFGSVVFTSGEIGVEIAGLIHSTVHFAFLIEVINADQHSSTAM